MSKRISQFSKEYEGLDNNKVIELLEKCGIEGKKAQSNISDEDIAKIMPELKKLGYKSMCNADASDSDNANDNNAVNDKADKPKEQPKEAVKTTEPENKKTEANAGADKNGEAVKADETKNLKKKKSIIIVGNGNSNNNRGGQNYNAQNRNGGGTYHPQNGGYNKPSGPIKPRANMQDRASEATTRRLLAEKAEEERLAAQQRAAENQNSENTENKKPGVVVSDNRDRRSDNRGSNGYSRDNRGTRDGYQHHDNRNAGNGNRFNDRNGQGQSRNDQKGNDRFSNRGGQNGFQGRNASGKPSGGKSFMADAAPIPENDRRRDKSKDKDKRNKNDFLYEDDNELRGNDRNSMAGRFQKPVKVKEEVAADDIKVITLPESVTIKELADKMKMQPSVIIKKLFMAGELCTPNTEISFEKAEEIALDYEIMCEAEEKVDVIAELLKEEDEIPEKLKERPPVICVMGHVDHGKTSLLDAIRKTNVTDREAGGITQHIGAYTVRIKDKKITFLDTPGHEAFTSMRMRGANSTDIAILVVAADDGVMPQTIEAINHAKAAGIEIIVAVNKIDKPGANIDRVKQELSEYELLAEDWGGSTVFVPVSAKTGQGIEDLLEMILLQAEVLELKANPDRKARGLVIEAELDKGRGPVATILVQKGTLRIGDFISAGAAHGKVRAMINDKGENCKKAGPSTPVEILGLSEVPNAGEIFICHNSDKDAKTYSDAFVAQNKAKLVEDAKATKKMSLEDIFDKIQQNNLKELNIIVKADVQGSVEAVKQSLLKLSNDEVVVKVIHGGVGAINESDVVLASASSAIIIGFNVRPDAMAKQTAEREGVDVRLYKVIYQAIEDVEAAMKGMLEPVYEEQIIGHARILQIFKFSKVGNIAGSIVEDGRIERNCKIRISREGKQIYEGSLASLKHGKDDAKEMKAGFECGLVFENFGDFQEEDIVEAYIMVEVARK